MLCSTDISVSFLVALFCGEKTMVCHGFQVDFLLEVTSLETTGLSYNGSHMIVKVSVINLLEKIFPFKNLVKNIQLSNRIEETIDCTQ
jgi:uncharacterized protein YlzI (FlbEa/FlbD family)